MTALRHRAARIAGALVFAALLLVPLVESGHSHANRDLARPCAACVIAHHSPAVTAPIVAVAPIAAYAPVAVFASLVAPLRRDHSPQSGRAPPRSAHSV
jgi:hypothetical protein